MSAAAGNVPLPLPKRTLTLAAAELVTIQIGLAVAVYVRNCNAKGVLACGELLFGMKSPVAIPDQHADRVKL